MRGANAALKTKAPTKSEVLFDIKLLNDIEDKMTRGLAKKIFIQAKRLNKNSLETVEDINSSLKKANKFTDDVESILNVIKEKL